MSQCIYCGREARKVRRGEHIIPDALGGCPTISEVCKGRSVCNQCNNEVLSDLDRELSSRSFLSLFAAQALDSFIWQTWEVDHAERNLLLEAEPDFSSESMSVYPQLIFERDGPRLYCDNERLGSIGRERFERQFLRLVREALYEFQAGKRSRLNPKLIRLHESTCDRYRYPPRVFARRWPSEFKHGMSFELQYLTANDKRFALQQISSFSRSKRFGESEQSLGSELPALNFSFELGKTLRALIKLGVNLIAAHCPKTPVDRESFRDAIDIVVGKSAVHSSKYATNGFVHAENVTAIAVEGAHSFRLLHSNGHWGVWSSFFGGRIGSFVDFTGPNAEDWSCLDIVAPLRSREWTSRKSSILQPLRRQIEWSNPARIMPSAQLLNVQSVVQAIPQRV